MPMAAIQAEEPQPRRSAEFVESSVLEAVVPSDSFIDIRTKLKPWNGSIEDEDSTILPTISQRQVLLFDERVSVYVVFRTPVIDEATLKAYLHRLAITLEAYAFSTAPPPEPDAKPPPPKELIFSETIKDSNEPSIVRFESESSSHVYVIWHLNVFISRPRGRFYKPAIYFQPAASLKPVENTKDVVLDDEYLPSRVPTAINLLQAFESDPALAETHPRLSALRISKIAPTAPLAKELVRPIRTGQRRLFRALPALIWRMRYSRLHASLSDASLLASLDLEVAHVTGCRVQIEGVKLSLRGGQVEVIADHGGVTLVHKPGDQFTYLYKIIPDLTIEGLPSYGRDGHVLTLEVTAKVLVSQECCPLITVDWKTNVDFTADQNATLLKAAHRLSNPTTQVHSKALDPDSLPSQEAQSQDESEAQNKVINVTVTLSGPPKVQVGVPFQWNVFLVNRSDKTRKLAVLTIPKRRREYDKHKSHPSTSSTSGHQSNGKDLLANAVVDENVVYAKQKNARSEVAELICLTTDVRIGHLGPGACYTADLKFLAISTGVLSVDAVRIVDLATQEAVEIRDLPGIVAVEKIV